MLSKTSINSAYPLAEIYANKEKTIVPLAGTPLHKLVIQTLPTGQAVERDLSTTAIVDGMSIVNGQGTGTTSHDIDMDAMIRDISNAVGNHFSFARNVAKPVVEQALEDITAALSVVKNPIDNFSVKICELPTILQTQGFEDVVINNISGGYFDPEFSLKVSTDGTSDQWLTALMTGNQDLDGLILQFVAKTGEENIKALWDNFIGPSSTPNGMIEVFNSPDGVTSALAVYLWAEHYMLHPELITGNSVKSIEVLCQSYRSIACQAIKREYDKVNSYEASGLMILGTDPFRKEVKVYGPLYKKWLSEPGHSSEIILGNLVAGYKNFTVAQVNETADKAIAAWNNYLAIASVENKTTGINVFKTALEKAILSNLDQAGDLELEYRQANQGWLEDIKNKLKTLIPVLGTTDMNDMVSTVIRIVCEVRFGYSSCGEILLSINNILNETPDMDPREAALVAQINYVSDWVAEQLTIASEVY